MQVLVERCHEGPQVLAKGRGPVEKAKCSFQRLARHLVRGAQCVQLLPKLSKFVGDEFYGFRCEAELPAAPDDLLCELCFFSN